MTPEQRHQHAWMVRCRDLCNATGGVMNKAIFEPLDELVIESIEGGLRLTQTDRHGQEASIWIPGRYVAAVIEQMELVGEE